MKNAVSILALLAAAALLFGCAGTQDSPAVQPVGRQGITLSTVEIRDYNGRNLSSVGDFEENSIKGTQHVDEESYRLQVKGLVEQPKSYTYSQVTEGFPQYEKVVTLNCVEGWSVNILWGGVLVRDVIAEAGPLPNAKTVIFRAYDGYSTSFPIEYITGNDILMAHKMNGITIPPERGFPFQLVAESKWGYKWIKWITEIEISDDENYLGFWEREGYSNSGDLDKKFIGDWDG